MRHGTLVTVTEGAFVGGPFLVFIPVAFCAALLGQARMVLEIAALHGRDTRSDARAADPLVLQGAYPDTLQAAPPWPRSAPGPRPRPTRWQGRSPRSPGRNRPRRPHDRRINSRGEPEEAGESGEAGETGEAGEAGEAEDRQARQTPPHRALRRPHADGRRPRP
ncbi:hypothetical protein ACU686_34540 [Yinghuangia aomiensis]